MPTFARILLAACAFSLTTVAVAQPPNLGYPQPLAVRPGETQDVVFSGGELVGASQLVVNFPATIELSPDVKDNGKDKGRVSFRIATPADVCPRIVSARVVTPSGVSPLRLFLVDDLPSVREEKAHATPAEAMPLAWPCAVDAACEAENYDYYRITAKAGEQLSVEIVAQRIGSPLDAVVRLFDATGKRELIYADDTPGLGADSCFALKIPADGDYLIEVRDVRYQGGGNHRYRLRVGGFPVGTVTYPLAIAPDAETAVEVIPSSAARLPAASPAASHVVNVKLPADFSEPRTWIAANSTPGRGSALVPILVSKLPSVTERVGMESGDAPLVVAIPGAINGRFESPRDRDEFHFEAKKGQRIFFRGITRGAGSPTDLFLRVYRDKNKVAESEDSGVQEGVVDFRAPDDGTYRLVVEDLLRRGGPEYVYRIEAEPAEPGFQLSIVHPDQKDTGLESVNGPQGGVWRAKVTAARRDYKGPIELSLRGADNFTLAGQTIAQDQNETVLAVTLPADLAPGSYRSLQIIGRAKIGERDVEVIADTAAGVQGKIATIPYAPAELTTTLALGVAPPFPDFFKLTPAATEIELAKIYNTTTLTIKAERSNGFAEGIRLDLEGLPAGVKAEAATIEKGKNETAVKLTAPAELAAGEYKLKVIGKAAHQFQPKQAIVENITLRVVPPFGLSGELAGPLASGGKQSLKITIQRRGEMKEPVAIALANLPSGVTAPDGLVLTPEQKEITVELSATADAAAVKVENVVIRGSTKVLDQAVELESAPLVLEVKAP